MKFSCLIVDDEPLAHEVLKEYINKVEQLEIAGHCYSAIEAINFINKTKVDVLFLDINMPELSGLEMLETLTTKPKVILTTAYSEFALDGYEFGVVDYLMKPIRFPRFLKAINRIESTPEKIEKEEKVDDKEYIEIKEDYLKPKVYFNDILYIQAFGNYLKIFTTEKMYMVMDTMKKYEEELPASNFVRIHKSYVINKPKVTKMTTDKVVINLVELPIGNSYKKLVRDKLS